MSRTNDMAGADPKVPPGCEELARMKWIESSECCDRCHSVQGYAGGSLGPCCVTLPDGLEVFVCCVGKRQLLEEFRVTERGRDTLESAAESKPVVPG